MLDLNEIVEIKQRGDYIPGKYGAPGGYDYFWPDTPNLGRLITFIEVTYEYNEARQYKQLVAIVCDSEGIYQELTFDMFRRYKKVLTDELL